MKECRYCGSTYADSLSTCPNCGGSKVVTAEEKLAEEKLYMKEIQNQESSVSVPADAKKNKSGIALVLGILAIVVIIGIVVLGGNGTSSSGQTKAESNKAYEQGVSCYNSGDYENAIMMLSAVADNSKHYDEAQEMLATASANYSADIISKANTYVEKQEYEVALSLLENALSILPEDTELQNALNRTFDEYKTQVCSTAIAEADAFVANGDYESAIGSLNNAMFEVGMDEELSAKLSVYVNSYKDILFAQAQQVYHSDGYQSAVTLLENAQILVGADEDIAKLIDEYNDCRPISVANLNCIYTKTGGFDSWWIEESMMGEDYTDYSNLLYHSAGYIDYELLGEYELISGSLIYNGSVTEVSRTPTVKFYSDGELIASYEVTQNNRRVDFSVDISGTQYLRIEVEYMIAATYFGSFVNEEFTMAGLSDFNIYKNTMP